MVEMSWLDKNTVLQKANLDENDHTPPELKLEAIGDATLPDGKRGPMVTLKIWGPELKIWLEEVCD